MRQIFITFLSSIICLVVGLSVGVFFGPQLKMTPPVLWITSQASKVPFINSLAKPDGNSPFEVYDYPTIKWRAKPLPDAHGAIVQLWTRYERADEQHSAGKMNYKLTVFKAPGKHQCEVQLLDDMGFKLVQFDASDFHQIPGAPDIMEARESNACTEDDYKKVRDYSIK